MAAVDLLHGIGNFADAGLGARRLDGEVEQVAVAARAFGQRVERRLRRLLVALGPQPLQLGDLLLAHGLVVDLEDVDLGLVVDAVLVDADDGLLAAVDARLRARGRFLDAHLGNAGGDRLGHAAEPLDLLDVGERLAGELVGQPLDVVAAAPRIDDAAGAGLLLQQELRVAGDAGGEVGRQRDGLVERVGVQRLRVRPASPPWPRCRCASRC